MDFEKWIIVNAQRFVNGIMIQQYIGILLFVNEFDYRIIVPFFYPSESRQIFPFFRCSFLSLCWLFMWEIFTQLNDIMTGCWNSIKLWQQIQWVERIWWADCAWESSLCRGRSAQVDFSYTQWMQQILGFRVWHRHLQSFNNVSDSLISSWSIYLIFHSFEIVGAMSIRW